MTVSQSALSVTSMPSTGRSWLRFGKKKKPTLHIVDTSTNDIVVGNKLIQNDPKLGKLASKRYVLLHVRDQDGNIGYVKTSQSKLLKLKGIDKEALRENINNSGSDITDYVLSTVALKESPNEADPAVKSTNEKDFDDAMNNENQNDKISELKRLGKAGYTPALHELGKIYSQQEDKKSLKYAFDCFKKAANLGYPPSKLELSRLLYKAGNSKEGDKWLLRAARDDDFEAIVELSLGKGSPNINQETRNNATTVAKVYLRAVVMMKDSPGLFEEFLNIFNTIAGNLKEEDEEHQAIAEEIRAAAKPKEPEKKPKRERAKKEKAAEKAKDKEPEAEKSREREKSKRRKKKEKLDSSNEREHGAKDTTSLAKAKVMKARSKATEEPETIKSKEEIEEDLAEFFGELEQIRDTEEEAYEEAYNKILEKYEAKLVDAGKNNYPEVASNIFDLARIYGPNAKKPNIPKFINYLTLASDLKDKDAQIVLGLIWISDPKTQQQGLNLLKLNENYIDARVAILWDEVLKELPIDSDTSTLREKTQALIVGFQEETSDYITSKAKEAWTKYLDQKISDLSASPLEIDAYKKLKFRLIKDTWEIQES